MLREAFFFPGLSAGDLASATVVPFGKALWSGRSLPSGAYPPAAAQEVVSTVGWPTPLFARVEGLCTQPHCFEMPCVLGEHGCCAIDGGDF